MNKIVVVGSGASGVHFTLSLLRKGYRVLMLDVGHQKPKTVNPEDNLNELKANLIDPVKYFLGENYEAVIFPDFETEYYGFPPNKNYVFSKPAGFELRCKGFSPLVSFAQGGLSEAWTGGVYPFNDHELKAFPFSYTDLEPYYSEIADRIGISGTTDDHARFYPLHDNLMAPLDLDYHSKVLLDSYQEHRTYLNNELKCFLGRSRAAVLSQGREQRKACDYSGRCLWGCPRGSLYTPSITLTQCMADPNFEYVPNMYVSHFRFNSKSLVTSVVAQSLDTGQSHEIGVNKLILAAGTLSSSKIFMDSIFKSTGEIIKLNGLMDNRQIFIPFVNFKMFGKAYNPENYQFHQITIGLECENPEEYIDGQITTLKTAMIHPIIQNMPLDLKTAIFVFRYIHAALGLLNISFHDTRRADNYLTLEVNHKLPHSKLVINYSPATHENELIKREIKRVRKVLRRLGCMAPSMMIHVRPMGASVHYAGTIPMSTKKNSYTTSKYC